MDTSSNSAYSGIYSEKVESKLSSRNTASHGGAHACMHAHIRTHTHLHEPKLMAVFIRNERGSPQAQMRPSICIQMGRRNKLQLANGSMSRKRKRVIFIQSVEEQEEA